jgi:hypothetical protein
MPLHKNLKNLGGRTMSMFHRLGVTAEAVPAAALKSSTASPEAWTPEQEAVREVRDRQMFWAAITAFVGVIGVVVGVVGLLR